ncbi:MAG: hypothetical protein AAF480_13875 [Actinomycetota bacterium]
MAPSAITVLRRLSGGAIGDVDFAALARPHDPTDYDLPLLDGSGTPATDIPLDGTAEHATWNDWAPRTLDGCREPLAAGAPDLRGVWECYEGPMSGHVERVEQAGNRITITTGGLVHDMFCDGTLDNGVDDVAGIGGRHIRVAATFEGGVHKLRPFGKRIVAVTRRRDGDEMVWRYGVRTNRLRRLDSPPFDHPATRAAAAAAGTLPD